MAKCKALTGSAVKGLISVFIMISLFSPICHVRIFSSSSVLAIIKYVVNYLLCVGDMVAPQAERRTGKR